MTKSIIYILTIGIILSSCKTENEKLLGHWHEYNAQSNSSEFKHCFIMTDSTFAVDKYTMGGVMKKSDYEDESFWISTYYPEDLIAMREVKKNEVIFGDSIVWKKQKDNLKTFISDFSAGIKLNIIPFETNDSKFEIIKPERISNFIYVGLVKKEFLNKSNEIIEGQYYLQLNDRITTFDEILNFISCNHCEYDIIDIFIHADQNIPKSYLKNIENEISKLRINIKKQVYYLYMNKNKRRTGYKKTTTNTLYNKLRRKFAQIN